MKKIISFILVLSLLLSLTSVTYAKKDNDNGFGREKKTHYFQENTSGSALTKKEIQAMIKERRQNAYDSYSEEEIEALKNAKKEINNRFKSAKVLDVDGVTLNGHVIKFDSPPYIKGGRTVIPVRAITQGLGASVSWDPETRTVTVEKDGIVIELPIGSNIAIVNGVEVEMDTNADITNARTYVPIRFIVETFKLGIHWDDENEIVEIDDEEDDEDTTDGAIETEEDEDTSGGAIETEEDEDTSGGAIETEEDEDTSSGAIETEDDDDTSGGAIEQDMSSEAAIVFNAPAEGNIDTMVITI